MKYFNLNCTNFIDESLTCNISDEDQVNGLMIFNNINMVLSVGGLVTNSLSLIIFGSLEKRRFFQYMKAICINSLIANCCNLFISFSGFVLNGIIYNNNGVLYFTNESFIFLQRYLYLYCYTMFHSLSGLYSVIIIYERILMYRKKWWFSKISPKKVILSKYFFNLINIENFIKN